MKRAIVAANAAVATAAAAGICCHHHSIILPSSHIDGACPHAVANYICKLFKGGSGLQGTWPMQLPRMYLAHRELESIDIMLLYWPRHRQYAGQDVQEQGAVSPVLDEQCALYGQSCGKQHSTSSHWRGLDRAT